ncbi:hypothetical protein Micbo1qcDRAFT_222786 [Microdochium bolleyi]|uniref:Uncharacterized protein n=1 Tax=Microdochium bolleyi TaxID=196109 RepID=A0A136J7F8_9PEZI|nr:hypothetical protein Micbo1qcDRAFT_222786 [Microdochium bolleyi]
MGRKKSSGGERKVTFSSPVVTNSGPISKQPKNNDGDNNGIHKDREAEIFKHCSKEKHKEDKGDTAAPSQRSSSRSRLSAQALAMLLKLADTDSDSGSEDGDGSSSSSSSSVSLSSLLRAGETESDGGSSSSSSSEDKQEVQYITRKSALKKQPQVNGTETTAAIDSDSHDNNHHHALSDIPVATPLTFTAAYAGLYPDRIRLYPSRPAAEDTAQQQQQHLNHHYWTQQDCDTLSLLEARQRARRWLELQAQFYNATGRMVDAGQIQDKVERGIARANRRRAREEQAIAAAAEKDKQKGKGKEKEKQRDQSETNKDSGKGKEHGKDKEAEMKKEKEEDDDTDDDEFMAKAIRALVKLRS